MAIYAIWNNKGGVGKSYLTFQIASEYARTHPSKKILVIDLCPQANGSGMLLGGMENGEQALDALGHQSPRKTISGYIEDRILSPYVNPQTGFAYVIGVSQRNAQVPTNLYLVAGDEQLEIQASRVLGATVPGPTDAWRIVHTWISDLIEDIQRQWNQEDTTVFIDCNPSFSIYTELALSASDRLVIPFSADGSSKRAVRAVLALLYGVTRAAGSQQSQFYLNSQQFRLPIPKVYCYAGNRLTQYIKSAKAFNTVVHEIGDDINRQRRGKIGPENRGVAVRHGETARAAHRIGVLQDDANDFAESERSDGQVISAQAQGRNANDKTGHGRE